MPSAVDHSSSTILIEPGVVQVMCDRAVPNPPLDLPSSLMDLDGDLEQLQERATGYGVHTMY
jgi:hypothetical protein